MSKPGWGVAHNCAVCARPSLYFLCKLHADDWDTSHERSRADRYGNKCYQAWLKRVRGPGEG